VRTPKPRSWGAAGQAEGNAKIVQGRKGVKKKGGRRVGRGKGR